MGQNDRILPLFTVAALVGPAGWLARCCWLAGRPVAYPIHFICRPPTICAPKIYFSYLKPPSPTFEFFCLVPLQCELHISCEVTHPHARVGRVGPWPGCYGPDLAWIALSGLDFRPVYVKYGLWLGAEGPRLAQEDQHPPSTCTRLLYTYQLGTHRVENRRGG